MGPQDATLPATLLETLHETGQPRRMSRNREIVLRRVLHRRGVELRRCRRRDPAALGYGRHEIIDPVTGSAVTGAG